MLLNELGTKTRELVLKTEIAPDEDSKKKGGKYLAVYRGKVKVDWCLLTKANKIIKTKREIKPNDNNKTITKVS